LIGLLKGELGFPASAKNKSDLLLELGQFLIARGSKKMTTVLQACLG
jgi:hypothetical protein